MSGIPSSVRARFLRVTIIALLVVCAIAGTVGYQAFRFVRQAPSSDNSIVVFEVKEGQPLREVARQLEAARLITDARMFRAYARVKAPASGVRVGEYALRRNMSPGEILKILASGRSIEYVVTVSEGLNRFEIADIIEKLGIGSRKEFLQLTSNPEFVRTLLNESYPTLEGYLFPETYYVTRASGVRGLVKQMVAKYKEKFAKVDRASDAAVPLTPRQIMVLASIVEKETAAVEERPVISSVFHNRLKKNMRLQTDPTVIYGIWEKSGVWDRNISRQDLVTPTPYNTYVISGLPPGPISNPGFEAMQAAARPAKSEFLFFVSRNDGTHVFSREYGQHKNAVSEYQMSQKARAGKSWRDLKKRTDTPATVKEAKVAPAKKVKK